jgi:hypothetical protein
MNGPSPLKASSIYAVELPDPHEQPPFSLLGEPSPGYARQDVERRVFHSPEAVFSHFELASIFIISFIILTNAAVALWRP